MDECRELDLADRYLNTKSTILSMNADRVEKAIATVDLFITDADGNRVSLSEMQCVWFEQAATESYFRTGDYGKSLKKALSINAHFEEFVEDQFDFHSYCMRKLTLRAYRDLLTFEDRLYSHKNYFNAACVIVKNYLELYNRPLKEKLAEEIRYAGLSGSELQKAKNKWKKQQRKKQQEIEKKRLTIEKEQAQKKKAGLPFDDYPDGIALEKVENPLNEAAKFASSLEKWCGDRIQTHLLSFEVFYNKKIFLRALRAVKKSLAMDPSHYLAHYQAIQLALVDVSEIDESVRSVFVEQLKSVTKGLSAADLNAGFSKSNPDSVLAQFSVARAELLIHPESKDAQKDKITNFPANTTREEGEIILPFIRKIYGDEEAAIFQQKAHEKYPLADAFQNTAIESTPEESKNE